MLHRELKERTQQPHHALEKVIVTRIKAIDTRDDYAVLLRIMFGFYAPLEQKIEACMGGRTEFDLLARRKASNILDDLCALQAERKDVIQCQDLPVIGSFHDALGALYVLEGSTLGGTIISGMIRKKLNMDSDAALTFFVGYGDDTPVMWAEFKAQLAKPFSAGEQNAIIRSAAETFVTFKNWIDLHAN